MDEPAKGIGAAARPAPGRTVDSAPDRLSFGPGMPGVGGSSRPGGSSPNVLAVGCSRESLQVWSGGQGVRWRLLVPPFSVGALVLVVGWLGLTMSRSIDD